MRKDPTEFRKRFAAWQDGKNPYSAGRIIDAIYKNNPKEEFLGEPSHNYDFTQSEEWADAHGYYPDERGHRDDRVKKPAHPSHPSRGRWFGDNFILTEMGMLDPNYIFFGLNDGGQDPQAVLKYKDGIVLPEITVTPKGNYFYNSYDNIRLRLPKSGEGKSSYKDGKMPKYGDGKNSQQETEKLSRWTDQYDVNKIVGDIISGLSFQDKLDSDMYELYRKTETYKKDFENYKKSDNYMDFIPEDELHLRAFDDWKLSDEGQKHIKPVIDFYKNKYTQDVKDAFDAINYLDEYYNTVGIKPPINKPQIVFKPRDVLGSSNYNGRDNVITFGLDYSDNTDGGIYGIAAHEYGHYMDPYLRLGKDNLNYPEKHMELYSKSKPDPINPDSYETHDSYYWENYADLARNRALMYKHGIYDSRKGMEIPMEAIKKYNEKFGKNNRSFRQFDLYTIYNMHKIIAANKLHTPDII